MKRQVPIGEMEFKGIFRSWKYKWVIFFIVIVEVIEHLMFPFLEWERGLRVVCTFWRRLFRRMPGFSFSWNYLSNFHFMFFVSGFSCVRPCVLRQRFLLNYDRCPGFRERIVMVFSKWTVRIPRLWITEQRVAQPECRNVMRHCSRTWLFPIGSFLKYTASPGTHFGENIQPQA